MKAINLDENNLDENNAVPPFRGRGGVNKQKQFKPISNDNKKVQFNTRKHELACMILAL